MNMYWKQQTFLLAVFEGADDTVSHIVACDVRSCASWNEEPVMKFYAIGFVSPGLSFLKSRIFLFQVLNGHLKDEKPKCSYKFSAPKCLLFCKVSFSYIHVHRAALRY